MERGRGDDSFSTEGKKTSYFTVVNKLLLRAKTLRKKVELFSAFERKSEAQFVKGIRKRQIESKTIDITILKVPCLQVQVF